MKTELVIELNTPVFRTEFTDSCGRLLTRIDERPLSVWPYFVRTAALGAVCLDQMSFTETRDLFVYARSLDEALVELEGRYAARNLEILMQLEICFETAA